MSSAWKAVLDMNQPESSRRQFLTGEAAIDAVGELGRSIAERDAQRAAAERAARQAHDPSAGSDSAVARGYLIQIGRRAMACSFDVFLNAGEHEGAAEHAVAALDLVDRLEDQLTVYRHQSEVSRLNAVAGVRPVEVERGLFELLSRAVQLFEQTHGAFDITAGPLIQAWGFLRRQGRMPDEATIAAALAQTGSHHLELDAERQTVFFRHPELTINLGAIGKGYALDRCADYMALHEVPDFMMHGGSSSILARGQRRSGAADAKGWTVGVQHPLRADRRLAEFQLCDRAVGTSGTGTQYFYHQGKRYGHILDPRTGRPADKVLSTTVIAEDATTADALATAFYVLGLEGANDYCQTHPEVTALMTTSGRQAGTVELSAFNAESLIWRRIDE